MTKCGTGMQRHDNIIMRMHYAQIRNVMVLSFKTVYYIIIKINGILNYIIMIVVIYAF